MRFSKQIFAQAEVDRLRKFGREAHVEFDPRHGADDKPYVVVTGSKSDQ